MNRPSADLMASVFPGVRLASPLTEFGTLLSIDRARNALGYQPATRGETKYPPDSQTRRLRTGQARRTRRSVRRPPAANTPEAGRVIGDLNWPMAEQVCAGTAPYIAALIDQVRAEFQRDQASRISQLG
jgi:hypothetical protein